VYQSGDRFILNTISLQWLLTIHNYIPLNELASIFVHNKLQIGQENIQRVARAVGEKLLQYSHEYGCLDTAKVEFQKILNTLDATISSRIAQLHGKILDQEKRQTTNSTTQLTQLETDDFTFDLDISSPFAKKKHGGEWDHDDRNNIGKIKDSLEKVQEIISIHHASVQEGINPTMVTEPCRSFFKDIATPIVNCLEKHFQNDVLLFINKHSRNG
jgi:hypothetical protein